MRRLICLQNVPQHFFGSASPQDEFIAGLSESRCETLEGVMQPPPAGRSRSVISCRMRIPDIDTKEGEPRRTAAVTAGLSTSRKSVWKSTMEGASVMTDILILSSARANRSLHGGGRLFHQLLFADSHHTDSPFSLGASQRDGDRAADFSTN